jgi:hypothetical protein
VSFSKLGTSYSHRDDRWGRVPQCVLVAEIKREASEFLALNIGGIYDILIFAFNSSDKSPLLNNSSSEHMFQTMSLELGDLLSKVW